MAKRPSTKKSAKSKASAAKSVDTSADMPTETQRPVAEQKYAEELTVLCAADDGPRPAGWKMTPGRVIDFLCGTAGEKVSAKLPTGKASLAITRKFVGPRDLIERCVVTLAGERGLLLVGQPGTAKSMLSELLAAAISGDSRQTVQGTAGTTEDQLRYGWNYALLIDRGPVPEAMIPSPVMSAMQSGSLARIEEVTRCLPEVQDALISLLSERRIMIPEFGGQAPGVAAIPGFNLIATANLQDRGVSEMSAALKRRFNFELVQPIANHDQELELVSQQSRAMLAETGIDIEVDQALLGLLVTVFRDLRSGKTAEGWNVERPATAMSTAEAVAVSNAINRQTAFFREETDPISLIPGHLLGVVLKDDAAERQRLLAYWDGPVRRRAESGDKLFQRLFDLREVLADDQV